jgi:hypothetical protein
MKQEYEVLGAEIRKMEKDLLAEVSAKREALAEADRHKILLEQQIADWTRKYGTPPVLGAHQVVADINPLYFQWLFIVFLSVALRSSRGCTGGGVGGHCSAA